MKLAINKDGAKFCINCVHCITPEKEGEDYICRKVDIVNAITGKSCMECVEARLNHSMCGKGAGWYEEKVFKNA